MAFMILIAAALIGVIFVMSDNANAAVAASGAFIARPGIDESGLYGRVLPQIGRMCSIDRTFSTGRTRSIGLSSGLSSARSSTPSSSMKRSSSLVLKKALQKIEGCPLQPAADRSRLYGMWGALK